MGIFKLAELFCGPGGFGLAAKEARLAFAKRKTFRIEHLWASDIDEASCETYRANICPDQPHTVICKDIRKLSKRYSSLAKPDGIAFGFPCNDFSNVGETNGLNGNYGPLYKHAVKAIEAYSPKWFIAENVTGLRNSNDGRAFSQILRDLEKASGGYRLTSHLYKFEKYGVPQSRHRILIVGIAEELDLKFQVPAPFEKKKMKSARQALENPPIPKDAYNHEYTKQSKSVVERLKHIPPGENAWYQGIPKHLQLNVKGARLSQIYKRLDPKKPSYTVTGSGGGGTHVYHWKENRALTNRERARLQTFPDSYMFFGKKESVRKQIGMAVPPEGVKVIFEAILKTFARIDYKSVPESFDRSLQKPLPFL